MAASVCALAALYFLGAAVRYIETGDTKRAVDRGMFALLMILALIAALTLV